MGAYASPPSPARASDGDDLPALRARVFGGRRNAGRRAEHLTCVVEPKRPGCTDRDAPPETSFTVRTVIGRLGDRSDRFKPCCARALFPRGNVSTARRRRPDRAETNLSSYLARTPWDR